MRQLKGALAVAVAAGALALGATDALASEFVADSGGKTVTAIDTKGKTGTEGKLRFGAGPYRITCEKATSQGYAEPNALFDSVKYASCVDAAGPGQPKSLPAVVPSPVEFEYSPDGFARLLTPLTIEIKAFKCTFEIRPTEEPVETVGFVNEKAATAKLKQFPSGFQHRLLIENELEYLTASTTQECAEGNEGKNGEGSGKAGLEGPAVVAAYVYGTLADEAVDGDLGWFQEDGELGIPPGGWNITSNT